jgi:hypothetical protein
MYPGPFGFLLFSRSLGLRRRPSQTGGQLSDITACWIGFQGTELFERIESVSGGQECSAQVVSVDPHFDRVLTGAQNRLPASEGVTQLIEHLHYNAVSRGHSALSPSA